MTDDVTTIAVETGDRLLLLSSATAVRSLTDYPNREMAAEYEKASGHDKLMYLTGKFVEAEQANVNGAFWDTSDLDHGERTVIHSPVNFLHRHRHVIGTFTDSRLVRPPLAAAESAENGGRPFLGVNAVCWPEFFPHETRLIEIASEHNRLFWSMECQSRTIRCETSHDGHWNGCGAEYPFDQVFPPGPNVCAHVREKSSQRHFIQPRFNAGAVIVPPVKPGWQAAHAEVVKEAERLAEFHYREAASMGDYDDDTLLAVMAQIVDFGRTLTA